MSKFYRLNNRKQIMSESMFALHRYYKYYQKLEPAFKNRKTQAYLMAVLSLMTISFFGFFAIRPTLKTIAVLQRQIIDRKTLNEKLDEKINALILAQDEYRLIEADLPLIYTLLPEKPEFPLLMRLLENLTIQNSATISGIQFDPIVLYEKSLPETETDTETKDTAADETIHLNIHLTIHQIDRHQQDLYRPHFTQNQNIYKIH